MSVFRGDRLAQLRKKQGISQHVLSELLGFSSGMIRRYEIGECEPTIERLCIIADYFGVQTDYFLKKDEHYP